MKKALWILILTVGVTLSARVLAETGNCGPKDANGNYTDNCTYIYDEVNKTLTISGEGKMADFGYLNDVPRGDTPWRYLDYETLTIDEGITSIGNNAFIDSKVKTAHLPDSLVSIGSTSFHQSRLQDINIPPHVTKIGAYALSINSLSSITLPEGLKEITPFMLYYTGITSLVIPSSVTSIDPQAFAYLDGSLPAPLTQIYCSEEQMAQCEAAVAYRGDNIQIKTYQSDGKGNYFFDNKWYASPNDIIGDNHIKKRIYTIDEATKVSKDTGNTFKLRYK